jgi:3-oxoisoapionate decarboxylase
MTSGALAAAAGPAAPLGMKLGFDSYSLRAWKWNAMQLLDYAASLKLDTIQISGLEEYESLEPEYLSKVKARAASSRITIDAGIGSICGTSKSWNPKNGTPTEYLTTGLKVAKGVGASSMRVFMGSWDDRTGPIPIDQHIAETVKAMKSVRPLALDLGVKIAIENHNGDLQAHEVRSLIEGAGKDYVGSCLDTGNPMWAMEDPLVTLEILGPYAVTTHVRDSVVFEHPRGAAWQWVALGDGIVDFKRFMARAKQLCPNTAVQIENITGRPPHVTPYLEPDYWKHFPNARAADFASFVALARRGHPLMETMVVEDVWGKKPPEYEEALKVQQKRDLERSLEYAKRELGLGINCRA